MSGIAFGGSCFSTIYSRLESYTEFYEEGDFKVIHYEWNWNDSNESYVNICEDYCDPEQCIDDCGILSDIVGKQAI